jgi:Phage terminase large subunit/Terminase RNaseH-like domain
VDRDAVLRELVGRKKGRFDLSSVCFDKQVAFIEDPARLKTSVTGRRAGKTYACAVYLLDTALRQAKSTSLYITLTRSNAKKIIWPTLQEVNYEYKLGASFNEADLSVTFPNDSRIFLSGANDSAEVEKFRGLGLALCIIDETQSFKQYLETLIEEVISKALYDFDGTLALIGTPGPIPAGYFYRCATSASFAHHKWTMFDNPHIKTKAGKTPGQILDQDLARKGVTIANPSIRREVFAEWVTDTTALVFQYNALINDTEALPALTDYVIGVDIGFDDSDAISVLGWNNKEPVVYLVEEYIKSGQTVTDLATAIERVYRKYEPLKIVMDTGGLGKKIAEELQKRYALPVVAAEKARKFEYIELLNDALRTARFKATVGSQFAQDCMLVEWDRSNPQKLVIKDTFHSDITDSVLYAYREALHWLYQPNAPVVAHQSPEWYRKIEAELERNALEQLEAAQGMDETPPWGKGLEPSDE